LIDAITNSDSGDNAFGLRPFLMFPVKLGKGLGRSYQSFDDVVTEGRIAHGEEGSL